MTQTNVIPQHNSLYVRFHYDSDFLDDVALFCRLYSWNSSYKKLAKRIEKLFTELAEETRTICKDEVDYTGFHFEEGYFE